MAFNEYLYRVKQLNSSVTIKEASAYEGVHFVELFNKYYSRKTSLAYFKWQFFESPFESRLFTAYEEGKLIGFYGIKIYKLSNNILTGFAIDFLVDEAYRKRGIAYLFEEKICDFCYTHKVSILTSLPNSFGNAALKALGWSSIAKLDTLIIDRKDFDHKRLSELLTNQTAHSNDECINFIKTDKYRSWRYDYNPLYNYELIEVDESTFSITKLFTDPGENIIYGDIVEIVYANDLQKVAMLFEKIGEYMDANKVQTITTWALEHTQLYTLLMLIGFTKMPQERFFCIKLLDENFADLRQIHNWDIIQSDAEIF